MKIFQMGEKSRAICSTDGMVGTTFAYRDVPFESGSEVAKNILVGVCDRCGQVVAIPPQSTPSIKAERERAIESIEVVLPANYLDTLDLACYRIEPSLSSDFRKRLLMFYIHRYSKDMGSLKALIGMEGRRLAEVDGMPRKRLSLKLSAYAASQVEAIVEATHLTKAALFRSIIVDIWKDIVVPKKPAHLDELVSLAAVIRA